MSAFTISTAPGVEVEARLHSPPSSARGLAMIAHPLGRLGGSLNDHVVQRLARFLTTDRSLVVVTYNSRGVGASSGSASFTGTAECADAQAVLDDSMRAFAREHPDAVQCELVICGYSAGAMYASTVRPSAELLSGPTWRDGPRPRFVLVSYPVSWTWALSLFRSSTYTAALQRLLLRAGRSEGPAAQGAHEDTPVDVLIVYGLQDSFTNSSAYERWLHTLRPLCPAPTRTRGRSSAEQHPHASTLHDEAIDQADHFWAQPPVAMARLLAATQRWMEVLDERRP